MPFLVRYFKTKTTMNKITINIISLVALLSMSTVNIFAQNTPISIIIDDTILDETTVNESFCVPIKATNFTDILAYQFGVAYDPSKLSFKSCSTFLPSENNTTCSNTNDVVRFVWEALAYNPITVEDETVISEICFDVIDDLNIESNNCTLLEIDPAVTNFWVEVIVLSNNNLNVHNANDMNIVGGRICKTKDYTILDINNVCLKDGDNNGSCVLAPSFGTAPYTIDLLDCDNSTILSSMTIDTPIATIEDLDIGNYCLDITDSSTPAMQVATQLEIISGVSNWDTNVEASDINCRGVGGGACVEISSSEISDPNNAFSYKWSNGNQTNCIINVAPGNYGLLITENATACTSTEIVNVVSVAETVVSVNLGADIVVQPGDQIELNPEVNMIGSELTYSWVPAHLLSCTDCPNPSVVGLTHWNNVVVLKVSDEFGCEAHDGLRIYYDKTSTNGNTTVEDAPTGIVSDNNFQNIWSNTFFAHDATYQLVLTDVSGKILFQASEWTTLAALQDAVNRLNITSNQLYIGAFLRSNTKTGLSKKQFYFFQQ